MKKKTWKSEYQRKKFMNRKTIEKLNNRQERIIAIMLDLQGTLDNMTDETAEIFMEQLTKLKTKFSAHKVLINISTHTDLPSSTLDKYMTILNRHLKPNIILDDATYLFGTYNFYTKECQPLLNKQNNYNKTEIFENRYLGNPKYDIVWFGIVDDALNPNYFRKFQYHRPMAEFIPSLSNEDNKKYDNLMSISTFTKGFLGVIECFDTYLNSIKDIPSHSLEQAQKAILPYLDKSDITTLFYNRRYNDILASLIANKIDVKDYEDIMRELNLTLSMVEVTEEELSIIKDIFNHIKDHINPQNKHLLEYKRLEETLNP